MKFKNNLFFFTLILIFTSTLYVKASTNISLNTDLNNDGKVNNLDMTILSTYYNKTNSEYDFNNDGIVDIYDMTILSKDITTVVQTRTNYSYSLTHLLDLQMTVSPQTDLVTNIFHDATREQTSYYINPDNFLDDFNIFQFLKLATPANINLIDLNNILKGKGILEGKGYSYITASKNYNLNEIYLLSHSLLETGNGTSTLATGVLYNGKTVYNMYGIGAIDSDPINNGAKTAYENGWFTPEKAIEDGAKFIGRNYIHAGQDTLYKMRWNPSSPATHQYATDIGWAIKQVRNIKSYYDSCKGYTLYLDIPVFDK